MSSLINVAERNGLGVNVAYAGNKYDGELWEALDQEFDVEIFQTLAELERFLDSQTLLSIPDVIMVEVDRDRKVFDLVKKIKSNPVTGGLIIILLTAERDQLLKNKAIELKVHDLYCYPFNLFNLQERIRFLIKFKLVKPSINALRVNEHTEYKVAFSKRLFDILASFSMLVLLSPILLLIAVLVKLESHGPVIYKSKRAGTGYRIFDFYKFRSMRHDADQQLHTLSGLNQYAGSEMGKDPAFIKIKNDPRITRLGAFLRRTSLDELPQLLNVLKGDMSMVGNRPLPLYEAERLTSNEWAMRFIGPAGITGLWQISKRGKREMSDYERRKLDNFYAEHYSFWFDLKIIIRTLPALLQKENV